MHFPNFRFINPWRPDVNGKKPSANRYAAVYISAVANTQEVEARIPMALSARSSCRFALGPAHQY
jgi:hypothetical protein